MPLPVSRLTVRIAFPNGASLPPWLGSAIRGGLGYALNRFVCRPFRCPYCASAPCLFKGVYLHRRESVGFAEPPKPLSVVFRPFDSPVDLGPEAEVDFEVLLLGSYTASVEQLVLGLSYLGMQGLTDLRHYGVNRFVVEEIYDEIGMRAIYEGRGRPRLPQAVDALSLEPVKEARYMISMVTPFTGRRLPSSFGSLLRESWRRLVILVNEYGDGSRVELPSEDGPVKVMSERPVVYRRRSSRSTKSAFRGWMGDLEADLRGKGAQSRFLISAGSLLGMGSDFTFGFGFFNLSELP